MDRKQYLAKKQREYRVDKEEAGYKRANVWLTPEAQYVVNIAMKARGMTQEAAINKLLEKYNANR
jgi:hypothetical protein